MFKSTTFLKSLRLLLLGAFLVPMLYVQSSAQYCDAATSFEDEYIAQFELGEISNKTGWQGGVGDYTNQVANLKMGTKYEAQVTNGNAWSGDQVRAWIDYNSDGKFDETNEVIVFSSSDGAQTFQASFTVPTDVTPGNKRLRVRMTYSSTPTPCGTQSYGEVEDYTVYLIPPIPDAQITALVSPTKPFLVGQYPVTVTLKSNNETAMLACKVDWWVNNVFQGTYNWSGNMRNGASANINLGNYNFVYPENEVNFNPFAMRFLVKDVNNDPVDADPSNDLYTVNISPNLNDCGAIGFFGPPEGFGAGVTPVRARVMNYAPKPLTRVTVYWKIDGVDLTPKTFTGLNVKQNQFIDLDMGTYTFYNKTPLGPFSVEVYTENPNGVKDEDATNDKYTGGIGPSLSAGTYYVGGANAHFTSPAEAASYINSSGVFGPGTVNLEVRPGTYTGTVVLNNKLANNNPINIIGTGLYASDVVIDGNPNSVNNFVVSLSNIYNVVFRNLTLRNNNNNLSNAGTIVNANNINGLTFHKVNFAGVANSPRNTTAYALINLTNTTNVVAHENVFNWGSVAYFSNVTNPINPNMQIHHNEFYNFSWLAIHNNVNPGIAAGNIVISDNKFSSNSGLAPTGGISSWNATSIEGNDFSGIVGTGSPNEAVIFVSHSSPNPNNVAYINRNIINARNLNGIFVNNAHTSINQNQVIMTQTANFGLSVLKSVGASGYVGNNMLMGAGISGLHIENSPNLWVIYNTSSVESNNNPAVRVVGSANIMRNIFVNNGTNQLLNATTPMGIDQNVIYTNGTVLANINGANYSNMSSIHNAGMMTNSSQLQVEFFSPSDPHLKVYNEALLFNEPLFTQSSNYQGWLIESKDFDGEERISYYAGMDEILLTITVERQTEGFIDCIGATDNMLSVSSAIGYNAPMTYQWEKDGVAIPGATEPLLHFTNLRHQQAGVYRCLVNGPGKTEPIYSREVAVYVTRPTDITRQPESLNVYTGEVAAISFDAHVNGQNIESAIANDEVQVRWYKHVDEGTDILITDNNLVSGAKSNYLTFRNFTISNAGSYYAVVTGLCGTVETERATLKEESLEINIVRQPINRDECEGGEVILTVDATTGSSKGLNYQWYKDGAMLSDNLPKIEGTTSKNLIIYDVETADAGTYYAVVSIKDSDVELRSDNAVFTVKTAPSIILDLSDATIESGKQLVLEVIAEGAYDGEMLNYTWYKDGRIVQDSDDQYYIVDVTTVDDAGDYYVVVTNGCGSTQSATVEVIITVGTTSVFEVSKNGYSLTTATPNPVESNTIINFSVPTESFVKITLTDVNGTNNYVIAEGNYTAGTFNVNFNAAQHNLASGTYYYFLESNGVRLAQKMVVVR